MTIENSGILIEKLDDNIPLVRRISILGRKLELLTVHEDPLLPYKGSGYISGLTKVKGEIHPNATLSLFAEDNTYISDTISNSEGVYTFTGLNETMKFFIVCKIGEWEHRVLSDITPFI